MASLEIKAMNLAKIQAKIAKLPSAAAAALKTQLDTEVNDLVDAQKRAAPRDASSANPGALADSIHAYPNKDREIGMFVIADAKDDDGKFIGSNIEQGHRARDGSHVAGRPSFFPTYRARKSGMKRRMNKAARDAIRQQWGS